MSKPQCAHLLCSFPQDLPMWARVRIPGLTCRSYKFCAVLWILGPSLCCSWRVLKYSISFAVNLLFIDYYRYADLKWEQRLSKHRLKLSGRLFRKWNTGLIKVLDSKDVATLILVGLIDWACWRIVKRKDKEDPVLSASLVHLYDWQMPRDCFLTYRSSSASRTTLTTWL